MGTGAVGAGYNRKRDRSQWRREHASNLSLNSTGVASVGSGGHKHRDMTVTQSGGTTFSSTVDAVAVTLTDTTGTIRVPDGNLTVATDLNTAAQGYGVSLLGGSTISNAVTFSNTGTASDR